MSCFPEIPGVPEYPSGYLQYDNRTIHQVFFSELCSLFVNMRWRIKNAKVHYLLQNTQSCDQTFIYISLSEQLSISLCCDAFITQVLWLKSGIEIALIYIMDVEASLSRTSVNRYQGTNIYKKTEWNKSYRRGVKTIKLGDTVSVDTCGVLYGCSVI